LRGLGSLRYDVFTAFSCDVPAPHEIYTLSLHDALPISERRMARGPIPRRPVHSPVGSDPARHRGLRDAIGWGTRARAAGARPERSEEHTSELQSRGHLVCRLLPEKNKKRIATFTTAITR